MCQITEKNIDEDVPTMKVHPFSVFFFCLVLDEWSFANEKHYTLPLEAYCGFDGRVLYE